MFEFILFWEIRINRAAACACLGLKFGQAVIALWADDQIAPRAISNKLSHIRQYLLLAEGDVRGINHPRVRRALDALDRDPTYTIQERPPIPLSVFKQVLTQIVHPTQAPAATARPANQGVSGVTRWWPV